MTEGQRTTWKIGDVFEVKQLESLGQRLLEVMLPWSLLDLCFQRHSASLNYKIYHKILTKTQTSEFIIKNH